MENSFDQALINQSNLGSKLETRTESTEQSDVS